MLQEENEARQECPRLLQSQERRIVLLQGRFVYDAEQETEQRQHQLVILKSCQAVGAAPLKSVPAAFRL